ncbi:TPA: hypothetical protein DCG86_00135 [Candidatus Marinimicrobia bacterium]|nr:MAG: Putative Co/Zn/Cd efflux system membrane fusion protein [Marinimicrobia bacterium 46_47]HAE86412.1 hypothetical protein [Candidatus Neomarinimicrobiota bacterium]HBY18551.1 hypothetical protein [Candidatus Neomarinimicrobiota bacterium]
MKKRWIIALIVLIIVVTVVMVSRKPQEPTEDYRALAGDILNVINQYDDTMDNQSARRMVAEIQSVIDHSSTMNKRMDDLIIIPVEVEKVGYGCIQNKLVYMGDIQAESSARVYAKIPDRIVDFPVNNGDYIRKGTVIARVEDSKLKQSVYQTEAALASAKSQLENLKLEYNRIEKLFKEEAVSESQYLQLKTQLEVAKNGVAQAQAAYNMVKEQLDDAVIKAPIDGYVSGKMLNVGDMAAGQMPIVTLTQKDSLKIIVDVIEKDIRLVKKGQNVNVYVDVFPEQVFMGEVARISPVVNEATRTSQVEILLKNPDNALTPGMFARLEIIVQSKDNVLLVNRNNVDVRTSRRLNGSSIRDTEIDQIFSVFVVENNLALEKEIEVGIRSGLWMEVVSGLEEGDRVVSIGRTNLRDSTMVNIVKVNS